MKHIVSFSGGKDSTAMLLMLLEQKEQVDEVLYVDTGWDFPEMQAHIDRLEMNTGIKFTKLKIKEDTKNYWMFDRILCKGKSKGQKGLGWPSLWCRWCTRLKVKEIQNYTRPYYGNMIQYVGYSYDEQRRASKHYAGKSRKEEFRYPLIEYKVTGRSALKYCLGKGYDWGGLYRIRKRVNCWCCIFQKRYELKLLYKEHPDLWKTLMEMDRKIQQNITDSRAGAKFGDHGLLSEVERQFKKEDRNSFF